MSRSHQESATASHLPPWFHRCRCPLWRDSAARSVAAAPSLPPSWSATVVAVELGMLQGNRSNAGGDGQSDGVLPARGHDDGDGDDNDDDDADDDGNDSDSLSMPHVKISPLVRMRCGLTALQVRACAVRRRGTDGRHGATLFDARARAALWAPVLGRSRLFRDTDVFRDGTTFNAGCALAAE